LWPTLFQWGGFSLQAYGLFVAMGFLTGLGLALQEARRQGIPGERILDLALVVLLSALIGSRLLYALFHFRTYVQDPWAFFKVWEGGLVFFGGLIAALAVGFWYVRRAGLPLWQTADVVAPSVAVGQVFGRLGCLAAGCCFGRPADLPWAITFTQPQSLAPLGVPLHPTQLYEALAALILFGFLLFLRRNPRFPGQVMVVYLFWSGASRFFIEAFRGDYGANLIGETWSPTRYLSALLVIFSLILGFYLIKKRAGRT
jgi:phosphatidylglycerol:prolipoprotein diacylglycerol transferase